MAPPAAVRPLAGVLHRTRHDAPLCAIDVHREARRGSLLTDARRAIERGEWQPAGAARAPLTLAQWSERWLAGRELKPRTTAHYCRILERFILPELGELPLRAIRPSTVREWHVRLNARTPTYRAHAYSLLRAMLATAYGDELIASNPCRIPGAAQAKRAVKIRPATLDELAALVDAMPAHYRAMVLTTAWCALRFGEAAALRRSDVDLRAGVLRIRRGVVRVNGRTEIATPKSRAGIRDVAVPPHLLPVLRTHIAEHAAPGRDGLLFPGAGGQPLAPSTLYKSFYPARERIGRPDLRWHDLRHTGAVLAAQSGATLAELMDRLGHSTPAAALRYQHAAAGRDAEIARRLSELAGS